MTEPEFDLQIIISENKPLDIIEWNKLAEQCGNVWQADFTDEVQLNFNNRPWYFQCYSGKEFIGGVKIYYYESKKLPAIIRTISSRATQPSELLFNDSKKIAFNRLIVPLTQKLENWLIEKTTTSFYTYSFFGEPEKLIALAGKKIIRESKFGIAKIDLTKNLHTLWKEMNPKHRSEVVKAEKNGVVIEFANDIGSFFLLMDETYKNQKVHAPNKKVIGKEYEILRDNNSAQLVFAKHKGKYLCGALLYNYGKKSLYNFGGTVKNSIGAGQFLHWEIIKYLKANGFDTYLLGETALEKTESNLKFSDGITKFKLRFGAQQYITRHMGYALKPMQESAWRLLKKIFIK